MLSNLGLAPSFGLGDRLGLATPSHIAAVRAAGGKFAPIFAQQSRTRECTQGRTPQQVVADAKRSVKAAKWDAPWAVRRHRAVHKPVEPVS